MSWACGIQWLFECWYNLYSCPSKTWGTVSLTTYASFTLFNVLLVSPLICHAHPAYLNPPDFETWILSGTVKDHVESWDEQASEDAGKLTVKVVNFGQNGGVRFRLTWCRISWREEIVSWSLSAWDKPIAMMPLSCRPAGELRHFDEDRIGILGTLLRINSMGKIQNWAHNISRNWRPCE